MANFDIEKPTPREVVPVGSSESIEVVINDFTTSDRVFRARIIEVTSSIPGSEISSTPLGSKDSMGKRRATVPVGDPNSAGPGNNRIVRVEDEMDFDEEGHRFRIIPAGSGSVPEAKPEQILFKVCRTDQPIPNKVSLKLDSALAKGACSNINELNRAITLTFSAEGPVIGKWLSKPINLGEKKPGLPAYWVLEKKTVKTWVLTLRQGKKALVTYAFNTEVAKDCSFPIQPALKSAGGKHFKKWPKTVTIKPAR